MALFKKIKWILGILMVFMLIITTNLIDRNNFLQVRDSVITIYEDRLVAKDIIFQLSKLVHEKEMAVAVSDSVFFSGRNKQVNTQIEDLITDFGKTKLTSEEKLLFEKFKDNVASLKKSEGDFVQSVFVQKAPLVKRISDVKENLHYLSKIQMSEGRKEMSITKKAIDTVELFTQIEIYILILLAIIIQILVIYNPKDKETAA